jgi:hypothetical protein
MVVVGTRAKSNCRFCTIVFLVWVCGHLTCCWWLQQAVIMHRKRSIVGTLDSFSHEVKLSGSDHVFNVRDVVEYASDLGISNPFSLHLCHVDGKNALDASMQEDLEFVEQALLE